MVHLREFAVEPKQISVAVGGTLQVMNTGTMPHNLAVKDTTLATKMIDAGGSENLSLAGLSAGTYTVFCEVPGHEQAGMVATLNIGGGPAQTAVAAAPTPEPTSSGDATVDFNASPAPGWHRLRSGAEASRGWDGAQRHFHAMESVVEVAPGVKQQLWTFNGQMPGPILRGHVGDVFNVTLVNDGTVGHSHRLPRVAGGAQRRDAHAPARRVARLPVQRRLRRHLDVPLRHRAVLHHIGNGMYGAVIIDPPGLAPVDHEYVLVQSELYLGPHGKPGDLRQDAGRQAPTRSCSTATSTSTSSHRSAVEPGERVRVWVARRRPERSSSFHIVGTIFDTVYKEGAYVLRPGHRPGRLAGARPPAGPGRLRRVHARRDRAVPDGDPQVRRRRQGRARPLPGR